MEKKIQCYLHLYLGCECVADGNKFKLHGVEITDTGTLAYDGTMIDGIHQCWWVENCDFKLILRPLSDMTEEEAIEVAGLSEWEGHFRDVKVERNKFNDLIVSWDGITEGGETFNSTGELFYCSDQFIYLLSKQFDLFELIEYGLAIDKTKLPAHA